MTIPSDRTAGFFRITEPGLRWLVQVTAPPGSPIRDSSRRAPAPLPAVADALRAAERHDMVLQAARALTLAGVTGDLADTLKSRAAVLTLRALSLSRALVRLHRDFTIAGVAVIALKGPALSQELFDTPALRDPGDIDLLIRADDLAAADALLCGEGYRREDRWNAAFAAGDLTAPLERVFHLSYQHPASGVTVELHWRWFHLDEVMPFDPAIVWTGTRALPLGGVRLTVLSLPVQLLYLSFHAAKHQCERLKWVCDLAWLLPCLGDGDLAAVETLARRLGILDLFLAPLLMAADLGLARLPPPLAALAGRPAARRLAALFLTGLEYPLSRRLNGTLRQRLHWQRTYWRLATHRERPSRGALLRRWLRRLLPQRTSAPPEM